MTPPRTSWRSLVRTGVVVAAVSLFTLALEHLGLLDHFETAGLDAFNVLHSRRDPTDIIVIGIDDADYGDPSLFNGTSPLKCEAVFRILRAIASGQPAAIGVDLDTSSPGFGCLDAPGDWPPIVWAQDALHQAAGHFTVIRQLSGIAALLRDNDSAGIGVMP